MKSLKIQCLNFFKASAQHKSDFDTDLAKIKEESLQTLDQQNLEIKTSKRHNNLQLDESVKHRCDMDNIVVSVNIENEELLHWINGSANELKAALNERELNVLRYSLKKRPLTKNTGKGNC